jgi:hypothetical protein
MFYVIHPNRWFIWTLVLLIAASLALMWFIGQTIGELEQHTQDLVAQVQEPWRTYTSEDLQLSVKYPSAWQIEVDPLDRFSVTLENSQNFSENITISVRDLDLEPVIRQVLDIANEEEFYVDGVPGVLLTGANERDTVTNQVVLVNHDSQLYYVAGSARFFREIVESIKFLE